MKNKSEVKNISIHKHCYGCGVCAVACNKNAIHLHLNSEGFYQPYIDKALCVNCGMCTNVCSFGSDNIFIPKQQIKGYAGWSKNDAIRNKCSSGGVAYELAHQFLSNSNGKAITVRYCAEKGIAEHFVATQQNELDLSIGSKYIQSYTVNAFSNLKDGAAFVVGTPCQIDSLRRYLTKTNRVTDFCLVDFFCHGVPSMLIWKKYLENIEKQTGTINKVAWRDKSTGWHNSWIMNVCGDKGRISSQKKTGDLFYGLFLGNNCLGRACYKSCKFKGTNSSADIRVGDFWGNTYKENDLGVSSILTFTEKGENLLKQTKMIELVAHDTNVVLEGQMKRPLPYPKITRPVLLFMAKHSFSLKTIAFINKVFNKTKTLIK